MLEQEIQTIDSLFFGKFRRNLLKRVKWITNFFNYLTVDDTMLKFLGRCGFKVYMSNKPSKYNVKIYSLCETRMSYFCNISHILAGKKDRLVLVLQQIQCCRWSIMLLIQIATLSQKIFLQAWRWPVSCKIETSHLLGTMTKNKCAILQRVLRVQDFLRFRFLYHMDWILYSFILKDRKVVNILTITHSNERKISKINGEPKIVNAYNEMKGDVNTSNQIFSLSTSYYKMNR